MHKGLPRQGPGKNACTRKAFSMLAGLPDRPEILDIGCGDGGLTVRLLEPGEPVPSIFTGRTRTHSPGRRERVTTVQASMDDLPFDDAAFDALWAEGSVFIAGFKEGLRVWKRLLGPGGFLSLTGAVWFTDHPSPEAVAFWNDCYPAILTVPEARAIAEAMAAFSEREIRMHREHGDEYGYVLFILRKR